MRLLVIITTLIFSGCTDAIENKVNSKTETCDISFNNTGPCNYQDLTVYIDTKVLSSDEKMLKKLNVIKSGNKFALNIIKDTSILDGDKGYVSFEDINFDGVPDIAITTSFGLANLYLDYWAYDTVENKFVYIGNFAKFEIDRNNKILSNVVKISAAKYKNTMYVWDKFKLIELKK